MPEICVPGEISLWFIKSLRVSKQNGTPELFIFHYSMMDVSGVVDTVKQKVKEQTGVMLECEVLIMK